MTNACPPQYRGLSPQRECYLRGLRLGTIEHPGAVPINSQEFRVKHTMKELRELILDAAKDGVGRTEIREYAGNSDRAMKLVDAMVEAGMLVTFRKGRTLFYRVAK